MNDPAHAGRQLTIQLLAVMILTAILAESVRCQAVVITNRNAVVWGQTQTIRGTIDTSIATHGEILVNGVSTSFHSDGAGKTFSIPVRIGAGISSIVARIDSAGTVLSSDTLRLTLGFHPRPEIGIAAAVSSFSVTLTVQVFDNPTGSPLEFYWSELPSNPHPVQWVTVGDTSATLGIPEGAPAGEYQFMVTAVSGSDTVRSRTIVTKDSAGLRPFDLRTDYAEWINTAIIYQITPYIFTANGNYRHVTAKIPDLKELGVNVLYLQPVYRTGFGGQGYDITDYFSLRTDLGSEGDLRTLIQTAHDHGLKVLFDFVPNHTSIRHPYAQDAIEHGDRSHYYDFYQRAYDQVPYSMHYHVLNRGKMRFVYYFWEDLPNLNYDHPEVRTMMIEAGKHWVEKFNIDGYRIDAVWGVNARRPEFMKQWRLALKRIKPDLLLLGEDKATWDSSFDERFDAAYDWARSEAWVSQWTWQVSYSETANRTIFSWVQENQRAAALRSSLTNGGTGYHPRAKILRFMENNDTFRFRATHDDLRTRTVAALMFSLDGIPMLYNGQEIGAATHPYSTYQVFSAGSPIWNQDPHNLFSYYRHLARLRTRFQSFTSRNFEELVSIPSASSYGYRRWEGGENVFVLVNMAGAATTGRLYIPVQKLGLDSLKLYYFTDLVTNEAFPSTVAQMSQFNFPIGGYSTRMFLLSDSAVTTSVPLAGGGAIPGRFTLSQNYPNPFNPSTLIPFDLPEPGHAVLKIYDVLGRHVATPLDEFRNAGRYQVLFDGSGLSSGTYFYHLRQRDQVAVRRMTLVK